MVVDNLLRESGCVEDREHLPPYSGICPANAPAHSAFRMALGADRSQQRRHVREVFVQVQRVQPPVALHRDVDLPVEERPPSRAPARLSAHCPTLASGSSVHQQACPGPVQSCASGAAGRAAGNAATPDCRAWAGSARVKSHSSCPARRPRPSACDGTSPRTRPVSPCLRTRPAAGSAARRGTAGRVPFARQHESRQTLISARPVAAAGRAPPRVGAWPARLLPAGQEFANGCPAPFSAVA